MERYCEVCSYPSNIPINTLAVVGEIINNRIQNGDCYKGRIVCGLEDGQKYASMCLYNLQDMTFFLYSKEKLLVDNHWRINLSVDPLMRTWAYIKNYNIVSIPNKGCFYKYLISSFYDEDICECEQCHKRIPHEDVFCKYCGAKNTISSKFTNEPIKFIK